MEIEKFINEVEEQGHQWVADEMRYYHDDPEMFVEQAMVPNVEHLDRPEGLPALYFYFGMVFGVGMTRKHDL